MFKKFNTKLLCLEIDWDEINKEIDKLYKNNLINNKYKFEYQFPYDRWKIVKNGDNISLFNIENGEKINKNSNYKIKI